MLRKYDHRIRNAIVQSGNQNLFPELEMPKSTIRDWLRKGTITVVTAPQFSLTNDQLIKEMAELKIRLARAEAKANLVTRSLTILGFQIQYVRLPSREVKEQLIHQLILHQLKFSCYECNYYVQRKMC